MVQEFREFISRGSFIDLAVGFVMGAAVISVVQTIVNRLIMPLLGLLFGEPNFDNLMTFGPVGEDGVVAGSLGAVITALVNFAIVAFVLFLVVRAYNRAQRRKADEPDVPSPEAEPADVVLLREIRDLLDREGSPKTGAGSPTTGGPSGESQDIVTG